MKISTSQFQRHPGKYFALAEREGEILIERIKPLGTVFRLSVKSSESSNDTNKNKYKDIVEEIKKHPIKFHHAFKDGVEYQHSVRQ